MSDLRFASAEDEMFAIINTYAQGDAVSVIETKLDVRWPGSVKDELPDQVHWARVSTQTVLSRKVGFVATGIGGLGKNRFEVTGLLFIQLFAPKLPGAYNKSKVLGDSLVSLLRKYRSSMGDLVFKKVRATSLDPESLWFRINVVAETEYTQLD